MLTAALALALATPTPLASPSLVTNSFEGPYAGYDFLGTRKMSPHWMAFGDTKVSKNFVRLTTDRQSKRGYAVNTQPVSPMDWVATMQFRVSGQGEKLFGDGMALWFVDDAPGALKDAAFGNKILGGPSKFRGFGILLDTFKNPEPGKAHKDISVVINDGTVDQPEWLGLPLRGCNSNFRFWEKRDDFDASKAISQLRVTYRSSDAEGIKRKIGTLRVEVDPKGDGKWETCVDTFDLALGDSGHEKAFTAGAADGAWSLSANLAVSAATGGVADNHDVVSLVVEKWTSEKESMVALKLTAKDVAKAAKEEIDAIKSTMPAELMKILETLQSNVEEKLAQQHHEFEHSIVQLTEALANEVTKRKEGEARFSALGAAGSGGASAGASSGGEAALQLAQIQALEKKIADNASLLAELTALIAKSPPAGGAATMAALMAKAPAASAGSGGSATEFAVLRREIDSHLRQQSEQRNELLTKLESTSKSLVAALEAQERKTDDELRKNLATATARIARLEQKLGIEANAIRTEIHGSVTKRLQGVEGHLTRKIEANGGGGGWLTPFLVLCAVVVGFFIFGYSKYKKLTRTHIL